MFSLEDVRAQLGQLGFHNVPDEVLNNFMDKVQREHDSRGVQARAAAAPQTWRPQSFPDQSTGREKLSGSLRRTPVSRLAAGDRHSAHRASPANSNSVGIPPLLAADRKTRWDAADSDALRNVPVQRNEAQYGPEQTHQRSHPFHHPALPHPSARPQRPATPQLYDWNASDIQRGGSYPHGGRAGHYAGYTDGRSGGHPLSRARTAHTRPVNSDQAFLQGYEDDENDTGSQDTAPLPSRQKGTTSPHKPTATAVRVALARQAYAHSSRTRARQRPRRTVTSRKNDPVSRYQRYKSTWERDRFLRSKR